MLEIISYPMFGGKTSKHGGLAFYLCWDIISGIMSHLKAFIIVVSLLFFFLAISQASASEILFEVTNPTSQAEWSTFATDSLKIAQKYIPDSDQEVCTVSQMVYRSGGIFDQMFLTVYEGGSTPDEGTGLAFVYYGGVYFPSASGYYASFEPRNQYGCPDLLANHTYWFVWSRLNPLSYGTFITSYRNSDEHPNSSYWQFENSTHSWVEYPNREWSFILEGTRTRAPGKEPVIIVPGIMGSRLNRVSDGEEVWPNITEMVKPGSDDYLNVLKLDRDGNEIVDIYSSEIMESVATANLYSNLIQKFKDSGYQLEQNLFLSPYDWRLDIASSSLELGRVVRRAIQNSPTGRVNFITHSMGGLLVKYYLMENGDSYVDKLIFAGTPHLGAPKAFNALNYGDDFDFKFFGFGLNPKKAKDISQNMPAVYELLPGREYINKAGAYVRDNNGVELDYENTQQLMVTGQLLGDHRNSALLGRADVFHQLSDVWIPQSSNVYNLLGCRDYDTIGSFQLDEDGSVDISSVTGDGTVPLLSSQHIPGDNYYVLYPATKINHTGLISDDRTIDLIYGIIIDNLPALPSGISQEDNFCDQALVNVRRLRFSTHSPVNLHVYDSFGNHTGLTPEENIEMGIPDSNFIRVGDNNFIFVPDGAVYSVSIDAYATGSFDFKVKTLVNGEVENSIVFDGVPIDTPSLDAVFEFININDPDTLDVDRDGDGDLDAGYLVDGSWIPYTSTIQSTLDDLDRVYSLGWTSGEIKNSLKSLLMAMLPTETAAKSKGKQADAVLGIAFLKQLDKEYNEGRINKLSYDILRQDVGWLLQ